MANPLLIWLILIKAWTYVIDLSCYLAAFAEDVQPAKIWTMLYGACQKSLNARLVCSGQWFLSNLCSTKRHHIPQSSIFDVCINQIIQNPLIMSSYRLVQGWEVLLDAIFVELEHWWRRFYWVIKQPDSWKFSCKKRNTVSSSQLSVIKKNPGVK